MPTSRSRREYLARIQRVQDHVERHLDGDLGLEELARIACFSPFHFHRVFGAVTGETLHGFILRLRLERAAGQLLHQPDKSITAVALDCGFGGSAAFARSFRAAYSMSATEFRAGGWREVYDPGMRGRKKRKPIGKPGKAGSDADGYGPTVEPDPRGGIPPPEEAGDEDESMLHSSQPQKPARTVRISDEAAFTVAYVRHVGPYAGDAGLFEGLFGRLFRWAGPRGLVRPGEARVLTVYHDDPGLTDADKLRISCAIEVPPGTAADGDVGVMEVPGGTYAIASFELEPAEYASAWTWLFGTWLPDSGFVPDDRPSFEVYRDSGEPGCRGPSLVDIVLPVRPL